MNYKNYHLENGHESLIPVTATGTQRRKRVATVSGFTPPNMVPMRGISEIKTENAAHSGMVSRKK